MCLTSKNRWVRIATEPIECVKILCRYEFWGLSESYYQTPFQLEMVAPYIVSGEYPYKAKGKFLNFRSRLKEKWSGRYVFDAGLIHTYKNLEEAKKHFPSKYFESKSVVAFKCYINPGTRYVVGFDGFGAEVYAAKKITFGEKLEFNP